MCSLLDVENQRRNLRLSYDIVIVHLQSVIMNGALIHIRLQIATTLRNHLKETTGTKESVLFREVSTFQWGKCTVFVNLGPCRCVLIREVCI